MAEDRTPAKYNGAKVEAVILEVAAEIHPRRLTVDELARRIVGDPDDSRETATALEAIRSLREFGLLADWDDKVVEPTPAALRAVALLT